MSLRGKTALITGGGAWPKKAHISLCITTHRQAKTKRLGLKDELSKAHGDLAVSIHQGDLTTGAAVEKLFQDAVAKHGKLDIVVNTVGMVLKKPIVEISEDEYDTMFAINSKAAFLILTEAAKVVQDGGKIITIVTALLAAFTGFYPQESKEAVEFHKSMAMENRLTNVADIAPIVTFLCTSGQWMTGQTIFANGGYTTR
ncbi:Putative short-chain dehydrogenase/reductase SDR, NAD(P)-binding domain superfamily [Septoria linicola]|uniref:Short-chain dehydrogenase/reductase SDR, NAD(P)-binding domain superfamily n=1 Tax=Septoria linicola TaxID=215465 RepID=A0A9Q9ARD4_9PEZI|nr:putative short-chain dehydrogenase/reductase SDR, NAD(P)-binding domain superfamily [Septoria linicola]USW53705.1 Putative short-chain dehydrogenase/reductase SDR, NAD(P)-binding domain superfamily [Septoria linicola]